MPTDSKARTPLHELLPAAITAVTAYAGVEAMLVVTTAHDCTAAGSIWPGPAQTAIIIMIFTSPIAAAVTAGALGLHILIQTFAPAALRARTRYAVPLLVAAVLATITIANLAHTPSGCRIDL